MMTRISRRVKPRLRSVLVTLAMSITFGLCTLTGITRADPIADFYAGRSVTVLIPSGPGGGYDAYARLIAHRMGSHIPGKPNLVPQNMPGAGGVVLANYLANVAAKDGTTGLTDFLYQGY